MFKLVVATVALIFLSLPVEAASFDCAKAGTPFEHAICDNIDVSIQDDILAKAYATAIGGLSDEALSVVRDGQRDWLDYAKRACSDDAQPTATTYTAEQAECLVGVFRGRIRDLEESRMRDGRRFYDINIYAVLPDPDAGPDSYQKVVTKEFSSPRIDGDDQESQGFNALLESFGAGADGSLEMFDEATGDGTSNDDVAITVEDITTNRIGLQVSTYWYGHGAAHGNYTINYLHYLTNELRALEASDVFDGAGWQDALAELVYADLERQFAEQGALFIEKASDITESASNPAHWNFSEAGLIVQFQPYEVTAYAAGAPTVTIPWDALRSYLAEGGESKAYY
jgi:uncharacterized protein YecT (DUF1311 family)